VKCPLKFEFVLQPSGWAISIPATPDNVIIEVDQLLIDASLVTPRRIEGYILAVHGLPANVADIVPAYCLPSLGVAAHLRPQPHPRAAGKRLCRMRLTGQEAYPLGT